MLAIVVAAAFAAGSARPSHATPPPPPPKPGAFVPDDLLAAAQANPQRLFDIILQGSVNHGAANVTADVRQALGNDNGNGVGLERQLATVDGASAQVTGKVLLKLAKIPGITAITTDDPIHTAGFSNTQQWPFVSGVAKGWADVTSGKLPALPAIAVVDSGVDTTRPDFGSRVIKQVTLSTLPGTIPNGDAYGHGTFVAGIAAGSATGYTGAAPSAPLVSLDVMDNNGMARTSDVIAAADWIIQNKAAYNIRVANFSLHASAPASVFWDPLDRAVERLWFSGVVVVAAAGNYGVNGAPSGVLYAPGNDPFVITVGADDNQGAVSMVKAVAAPWSAYGYTYD
ncbi:MAG TPA: S8 family serine peptidase, partial [Gaiellaceae bacterium]|nr:S8 family serine peptidase [Gaiellaceae bacterium]